MSQHTFSGSGAPTFAPTKLNQHYTDTASGVSYFSVGTSSSADWKTPDASGAIAAHVAAADPHGIYLKESDNLLVSPQVVKVKVSNAGAGEFTDLSLAIASITDADSATKPYIIEVGPGVHSVDNPVTIPSGVSVRGEAINATVLKPLDPAQHLLNMSNMVEVSFLSLQGISGSLGSGKSAIYAEDVGEFAQLHKISIYDFDTPISNNAVTTDSWLYGEYVDINGDYTFAVKNTASGSLVARAQMENFYTYASATTGAVHAQSSGTNAELIINSAGLLGDTTNVGIKFFNGGKLSMSDVVIDGFAKGLLNSNTGAGTSLDVTSVTFKNSTSDIEILNPGSSGAMTVIADKNKVTIDDAANMSILVSDSETGGIATIGELNYSPTTFSTIADIGPLVTNSSTTGVYFGGALSAGSGLTLNIAALRGYLDAGTAPDTLIKHIILGASTLTMTASSNEFVYVNSSGTIVKNAALPSTVSNILLGRVVTDASAILFIENAALDSAHYSNKVDRIFREAIGPIYSSGSLVSETGTRGLNITAGEYYFSQTEYKPDGSATASWTSFYRSTTPGVYTKVSSVTQVDNGFYDDGSGTLAAIPSGRYAKHLLLVIGGPSEKYVLIYATAHYATSAEATAAALPTVPSFVSGSFARVTSLVVSPGTSTIVSILDERPRIGFASSSSVGGVTSHSALSNLSADDHTIYIKADGSRAYTGNQSFGGNNITSVGTLNSVTVEAHASRHLPNGADALATGAPSAIGNSAATGTANAFSRQDHIHPHGSQTVGTHHAAVTTSVNGFMDSADKIKLDSVTTGELGYLSGVTSGIQGQLDNKQATGNYITALTGDATASGPGSVALTLANSGVTAGTYSNANVTVDAKGRVTSASSGAGGTFGSIVVTPQSTTSTTHAAVTELLTPSLDVGTYKWEVRGKYRSAAVGTGAGFRIIFYGNQNSLFGKWEIATGNNGTDQDYQYKQMDQAINVTSTSVVAANTDYTFMGSGIIDVVVAGAIQVQFRSENNVAVTIMQGSTIFVTKVI